MRRKLKNRIDSQIYRLIFEKAEDKADKASTDAIDKSSQGKSDKKSARKQKAKSGTISTAGAFGSGGRAKQFIADAKSRSVLDPEGLMSDLGVKTAEGNSDLQRALSVINQAIHINDLMSMAYQGAAIDYVKIDEESKKEAIVLTPDRLDVKNGIRFMALVLDGAKNAGVLTIENMIQFMTISGQIAILEIKV